MAGFGEEGTFYSSDLPVDMQAEIKPNKDELATEFDPSVHLAQLLARKQAIAESAADDDGDDSATVQAQIDGLLTQYPSLRTN